MLDKQVVHHEIIEKKKKNVDIEVSVEEDMGKAYASSVVICKKPFEVFMKEAKKRMRSQER